MMTYVDLPHHFVLIIAIVPGELRYHDQAMFAKLDKSEDVDTLNRQATIWICE